jgi:hypothetical protein
MTRQQADFAAVMREFEGVDLGDERLERRARAIVKELAQAPGDSFPQQMRSVAEREALYRFFANVSVTTERLLEGHVRATHERMGGRPVVRVVHDTTAFRFAGDRDGLGVIRGDVMGFYAHVALALAADETREPLGVLAVRSFIHADAIKNRGLTMAERKKLSKSKPRAEKESSRWENQAVAVAHAIPSSSRAIHLMDQEADDHTLFAELLRSKIDFIVRVAPQRKTTTGNLGARDLLASQPASVFRKVHVSERPYENRRLTRRGARTERDAQLFLRWGSCAIASVGQKLCLNAVHVFEKTPPKSEAPVEWMLFTTEKVDTVEDAIAIVDHYRARWVVEEYFKALKTGCSFEKRQLTSLDALTKALALFVPIAWQLLTLRHLGRQSPSIPGNAVFTAERLLLLRTLLQPHRVALPKQPTVADIMTGVAALGGHIRNNGDPGWLVLGRGLTRFLEAEIVWNAARKYDQS